MRRPATSFLVFFCTIYNYKFVLQRWSLFTIITLVPRPSCRGILLGPSLTFRSTLTEVYCSHQVGVAWWDLGVGQNRGDWCRRDWYGVISFNCRLLWGRCTQLAWRVESLILPRFCWLVTRGERSRQINRDTDRQTDRQTDKQMDKRTDRWTNGQTNKQTGKPDMYEQADRQTDRQTDRWM